MCHSLRSSTSDWKGSTSSALPSSGYSPDKLMTAPKFPRRRAPHTKVSTGCYSCKKRRLKCDEQRPVCKRCQSAGFDCEFPPKVTPSGFKSKAVVVPLHSAVSQPVKQLFHVDFSPTEALYYDFFCNSVIVDLATHSYSPSDLTRVILRECVRDDAVRLSILSIGALALANRGPKPMSNAHKSMSVDYPAWQNAVSYHTKAISTFRAKLSKQLHATPARSVLIISILFILFELAQGNTEAVDKLTSVALSSLEHSLRLDADATGASLIPAKVDDNGVRGLEVLFFLIAGYSGTSFPGYARQMEHISNLNISTLKEAVPGGIPRDNYLPIRLALDHWEAFVARATMWGARATASIAMGKRSRADPELIEGQRRFLSQILEWEVIMRVSSARETGDHAYLLWLELLYGANLLYCFAAGSLDADERRYDPYVERFRVAINMIEQRVLAILSLQQAKQTLQTPEPSEEPTKTHIKESPPPETPSPHSSSSPEAPSSHDSQPDLPVNEDNPIPTPSFGMPVLNSRLLQSLSMAMRACRDRDIRMRFLRLCGLVIGPTSTWDDKATFIGSKTMVELEEGKRTVAWSGLFTNQISLQQDKHGSESSSTADVDPTVVGVGVEHRVQWKTSEWEDGHARLKLEFVKPWTGEILQMDFARGGEYDYLLTE